MSHTHVVQSFGMNLVIISTNVARLFLSRMLLSWITRSCVFCEEVFTIVTVTMY